MVTVEDIKRIFAPMLTDEELALARDTMLTDEELALAQSRTQDQQYVDTVPSDWIEAYEHAYLEAE